MIFSIIIAIIAICADQATKWFFYGGVAKSILGNVVWFESTLNTGVAFGMFADSTLLFVFISSIATVVFVYLMCSKKFLTSQYEKICLGVIMAGTFSNLLDRLMFGGVRDFIYLKFINFPIFNIADMCITIGVVLLCVYLIFKKPKKEDKW